MNNLHTIIIKFNMNNAIYGITPLNNLNFQFSL